jgi:hypothetical protein
MSLPTRLLSRAKVAGFQMPYNQLSKGFGFVAGAAVTGLIIFELQEAKNRVSCMFRPLTFLLHLILYM